MTTPIADFVKAYADSETSRFHMPGHKGKSLLGCESLDITEIRGADVLSAASGIIAQSEANAASLFNTAYTFYSTEGSSLCIRAMLSLVKKLSNNSRTKVLSARNSHKAFIYACALCDIEVDWIYPTDFSHLCSCAISPEELEIELNSKESLPHAVYITSPDYLGNVADINGLSKICHKYGIPLLVDNAHGAYLAFRSPSAHPISLGADMCCDSAHKTLPVLTGGAYLHISKNFNRFSPQDVRNAMAVFSSTSPSYIILQSLDLCNAYLSDSYGSRLEKFIRKVTDIKEKLASIGFPALPNTEDLKIVFSKNLCGYEGYELAEHLSKHKIEAEFYDRDFLVLMLTPSLSDKDLQRLIDAFSLLTPREHRYSSLPPKPAKAISVMSIRDAIFCNSETVLSKDAEGRICASPIVSCPPAIPIVVSGEIIDNTAVELLSYYGINEINVIK